MIRVSTFKDLCRVVAAPILVSLMVACAPPEALSLGAANGGSGGTAMNHRRDSDFMISELRKSMQSSLSTEQKSVFTL